MSGFTSSAIMAVIIWLFLRLAKDSATEAVQFLRENHSSRSLFRLWAHVCFFLFSIAAALGLSWVAFGA